MVRSCRFRIFINEMALFVTSFFDQALWLQAYGGISTHPWT